MLRPGADRGNVSSLCNINTNPCKGHGSIGDSRRSRKHQKDVPRSCDTAMTVLVYFYVRLPV